MLDPNSINIFLELAKTGNITHVARSMAITPSAISQRLKLIEDQAGMSLFIRKRSGVELNTMGKNFLNVCAGFKKNMDEINNWLMIQNKNVSGEISITTPHSMLSYDLPDIMQKYLKKYPNVNVELKYVNSSRQVEETVLNGQTDIGIIANKCSTPSLKMQKLLSNNDVMMICSPDFHLAGSKKIKTEDLKNTKIIWHASRQSKTLYRICKILNIDLYECSNLRVPDMESCKKYASKGLGIAFVSKLFIVDELKKKTLVALPGLRVNAPIYMISRNEKYLCPALTYFKDELVDYCTSILDKKLKTII